MENDSQDLLDRKGTPPAPEGSEIAPEQSAASLVHGIMADVQQLIQQQLVMFRQEIQDTLSQVLYAAITLAVASGITAVGSGMLLLMLPLLLNWYAPELPLWACFGIVGGTIAVVGGIGIFAGVRKVQSCHPLSSQAVEAFKETFTWKTNAK
jgi:Putative Actinobacterial Holin-X, holin superfamily III